MSKLYKCSACGNRAEELYRNTIECDDYDCEKYSEDCTECFEKKCNDDICEEYGHNCEQCDISTESELRYVWGFKCEQCNEITEVVTEIDRY